MKPHSSPLTKHVVLVGAGNAHLLFVRRFAMHPIPEVALTLVDPSPRIPYSAMVPSCIAGEASEADTTIDLVSLCAAAGVRFIRARVLDIQPKEQKLHIEDHATLRFDALSIGIGSVPLRPPIRGDKARILGLRPLSRFLNQLSSVDKLIRDRAERTRFLVIGGGATGCELALALRRRFADCPRHEIGIVQAGDRFLPKFPRSASTIMERQFIRANIATHLNACVTEVDERELQLEDGRSLPFDYAVFATTGLPPMLLASSGLALDSKGFLRVRRTLQSLSNDRVFGAGDCIALDEYLWLERAGVYAVKQGEILWENVNRLLARKPLLPFKPRRKFLAILNTSDGDALLRYGPIVWKGRRAKRLKDGIDHKWMSRFAALTSPKGVAKEDLAMRCGGCGNKVARDVLTSVLTQLNVATPAEVVIGLKEAADAAAVRLPSGELELHTVDYFKTFTPDPFLLGRVAALHATNDIFAMNGTPKTALAIATLPIAGPSLQQGQLEELLQGVERELSALGTTLIGGHTTEGDTLAVGLAVTGRADEKTLFRKGALRSGDSLVITKPIGTGAILAGWARAVVRAEWVEGAVASMLLPSQKTVVALAEFGVRACTDVSGFGLLGHLLEMLEASHVSARLKQTSIPLLKGFAECVNMGILSTLHEANARFGKRLKGTSAEAAALFDPQTSGGLLFGIEATKAPRLVVRLQELGYLHTSIIGDVIPIEVTDGTVGVLRY